MCKLEHVVTNLSVSQLVCRSLLKLAIAVSFSFCAVSSHTLLFLFWRLVDTK